MWYYDGFDEICILIMIHKLDSKLISKTKKKLVIIIVVVVVIKYLSFIFGSHFAYSSIKIGFKLHPNIYIVLSASTTVLLAKWLFCYNTFSNKFLVSVK